jgi:hypothetical protein
LRRDEQIQKEENGYTLLTSTINDEDSIGCPENDMIATRKTAEEVEITFTKSVKITKTLH